MNRMSPKTRRYLTLAVTAFVSVGAAALIIMNRVGVEAGQAAESASSTQVSSEEEVSVPPIIVASQESKSGSTSAFVPSSGASKSTELTKLEKPTSTPPKPSTASGTNFTDKTKKPSYSSKPTAKSKTASSNKPKAGDIKDGKMYDPDFGWVSIGGTNKQTTVGKPGDELTGNKVGIMD